MCKEIILLSWISKYGSGLRLIDIASQHVCLLLGCNKKEMPIRSMSVFRSNNKDSDRCRCDWQDCKFLKEENRGKERKENKRKKRGESRQKCIELFLEVTKAFKTN